MVFFNLNANIYIQIYMFSNVPPYLIIYLVLVKIRVAEIGVGLNGWPCSYINGFYFNKICVYYVQ